ncbi:MAG: phage holin family protein [Desulfovibrio sp.]|nr:phage holin family protein [Desulfovibrio sp.]
MTTNPCDGFGPLLQGIAVPLCLAVAATFVKISRIGWHSWTQLFSSLLVSSFVAVLVYWGLDYFEWPPTVDAAIIGMSAYMGGNMLDTFVFKIRKTVGTAPMMRGDPR